jgi:hypothetical protein
MANTTKQVNYTSEQTAEMIEAYTNEGIAVEALAERMGKSVRSIVAKLSREGCYKAKVKTAQSDKATVKKDDLAYQVGFLVCATEAECASLAKANRTVLDKLLKAIKAE